VVHSLLMVIVM